MPVHLHVKVGPCTRRWRSAHAPHVTMNTAPSCIIWNGGEQPLCHSTCTAHMYTTRMYCVQSLTRAAYTAAGIYEDQILNQTRRSSCLCNMHRPCPMHVPPVSHAPHIPRLLLKAPPASPPSSGGECHGQRLYRRRASTAPPAPTAGLVQ